jgi:hypothetical protein
MYPFLGTQKNGRFYKVQCLHEALKELKAENRTLRALADRPFVAKESQVTSQVVRQIVLDCANLCYQFSEYPAIAPRHVRLHLQDCQLFLESFLKILNSSERNTPC